jgi:hypothetical protein
MLILGKATRPGYFAAAAEFPEANIDRDTVIKHPDARTPARNGFEVGSEWIHWSILKLTLMQRQDLILLAARIIKNIGFFCIVITTLSARALAPSQAVDVRELMLETDEALFLKTANRRDLAA